MGTICLTTESKSRTNGVLWTIVWMLIILAGVVSLTTFVTSIYAQHDVASYKELDDQLGWRDDGTMMGIGFANAGRITGIAILLLQLWHLLSTIFAWRSEMTIDLNDEGHATSVTHTWRTFPWGQRKEVTPINRIKEVSVVQSTTNRLLGVGVIRIEAETFVLKGSVSVSLSIDGVSDPFGVAEKIKAAMPPHQGLLLAHVGVDEPSA